MISFSVACVPCAQPRQRHRVVNQPGKAAWVQNYTPTKHPANVFKAAVQKAFSEAHSGAPLQGPLALRVLFLLPRPGRLIWKKRPMPRLPHDGRPDLDNLIKCAADGLKSLAWADDAQVADVTAKKRYAGGDEQAGAYIEIEQIEPQTETLFK